MRTIVVLIVAGALLIVFAAPGFALPRIVVLQPDLQPWIAPSAVPVVGGLSDLPTIPQSHLRDCPSVPEFAQLASVVLIC
jgi:hypothetical protein